jgi:hypothetical protein
MSEYYDSDFADPEREIIRPRAKKRHDPFEYCKWAAGDWDARFYAWTPTHRKQCAAHLKQLINNPAWFKCKAKKVDKKAATRNRNKGKKTQEWIT